VRSYIVNHSKITFLKKGTKKRQVYAPKEGLQKRTFAQNCFNLTINKMKLQNYFCAKKDKKVYLPYKSSDIKKLRQL